MTVTPMVHPADVTPDARIAAIASRQHSVFTRAQAIGVGLTPRMIQGRVDLGIWQRLHHRLYRIAGSQDTFEQGLVAACLSSGPDTVASHRSAAQVWGLPLPVRDVVEVSVPRGRAPQLIGVVAHRTSDLSDDDVITRHRVPVTKPARTLVDLGAVCPPRVVDRAIDGALAARLIGLEALWWMLARVARKGRSGAGVLRQCLEWRFGVPESVLEGLFLSLVRDFALPPPVVQYRVMVDGRERRIDAAYPDRRLAIELDGAQHRMSPAALQADLRRQNALTALGFTFLRFTFDDLTLRRSGVARQVREVHAALPVLERVSNARR